MCVSNAELATLTNIYTQASSPLLFFYYLFYYFISATSHRLMGADHETLQHGSSIVNNVNTTLAKINPNSRSTWWAAASTIIGLVDP